MPGPDAIFDVGGKVLPSAVEGQRSDLFPLLADCHDRLQAPISRTDHLKHPLVLRSSVEECGKIFVWIRVLHGARVAALTVIDLFVDERRNGLRAIASHGTGHSPKYPALIDGALNPTDSDART